MPVTLEIDPGPNELERMDSIWAFISVDKNGKEGLCAGNLPPYGMTPLVTSFERLLPAMHAMARVMQQTRPDLKIKLVRFTNREEVETL